MNFNIIQTQMGVLNTGPENPLGNCSVCAVLAARHLVNGTLPAGSAPGDVYSIPTQAATDHAERKMHILPDINAARVGIANRQTAIWQFLQLSPPGVFVLEQSSDHVYNFIKHGGSLCLVDAATNTIKLVNSIPDCTVATPPYPSGYNYLDPATDDDDDEDPNDDTLSIWRWGDLAAFYQ